MAKNNIIELLKEEGRVWKAAHESGKAEINKLYDSVESKTTADLAVNSLFFFSTGIAAGVYLGGFLGGSLGRNKDLLPSLFPAKQYQTVPNDHKLYFEQSNEVERT